MENRMCKGASHYGLSADRKRRSQEGDCTDSTSELTVATLPGDGPASAAVALLSDEPGLVNPAFDPSMEDNSQSGSTTSLAARSSTKKIRNYDRTSVRSRSFRRLNRAFSVLRRTKMLALPQLHHLIPDGEVTSIKINREPSEPLAISIVGGNETPLVRILIQDIYREGVIARDGRLLPGDIILKPCQLLRLTVLREQRHRYRSHPHNAAGGYLPHGLSHGHPLRDDSIHVVLAKSTPEEQLGIKLRNMESSSSTCWRAALAAHDGQLSINDRVLAINGHDLRYGAPEHAALLIQDSCEKPAYYEKTVTLSKEPHHSLGMTVAGGMSSRGWDLPVYVTNVDPNGVVGQEGSIRKGDILLNVNGLDLTGVTRGEAVANLKNTTSPVVLKVLEIRPPDEIQQECPSPPCLSPSPTNSTKQSLATLTHTDDYSPLWVSWLQLPRHLYCCKDIVLRRSASGSLGFSIVGGQEEVNCNQSFFIRSILEGMPAYNDGRIRCGDILLEVNGKSTWGMTHTALVRLLKELRGRITLTIVSWPGSLFAPEQFFHCRENW
ncbi:unnamed protein product [Coregonus sp. 'balchen']|nr:unnamed protein product [Coregonus sp. 'balchen']